MQCDEVQIKMSNGIWSNFYSK